jgi:hypothetical protein
VSFKLALAVLLIMALLVLARDTVTFVYTGF